MWLLLACSPGSVEVEGDLRPFGTVRAALRTNMTYAESFDLEDGALGEAGLHLVWESITLYDGRRSCEDYQAAYTTWGAASARLVEAAANGDYCEAVPAFYDALAVQDAEELNATNRLVVSLCLGDLCDTPLADGAWPIGGGSLHTEGWLVYTDPGKADGPAERARDAWGVRGCAMPTGFWEEEEENRRVFDLPDGEIRVELADDGDVTGELEADVADGSRELVGSVAASFRAESCVRPDVEVLVFW